MSMQYSSNGIAFTKRMEGLRLTAYRDTGGVLTIGYGHTGPDVRVGQTITAERAEALLVSDLQHAISAVNTLVKVTVTQGQFDALVDFTFNVGDGQFKTSTLLRKVNAQDFTGAAAEFARWIYDNGRVINGLLVRRTGEKGLFEGN